MVRVEHYSSTGIFFPHPEPPARHTRILPVFLPFAGCPSRCLFCAQDVQTGALPAPLPSVLDAAEKTLAKLRARNAPLPELAFYGGTFTAMPLEWQSLCLNFAEMLRARGLIAAARCSTRPDAVTPSALQRLKNAGLSTVELGVQSFHTPALTVSGRGYPGETALAACRMVQEAGLTLGVQLMPGMPGLGYDEARNDIDLTLAARPGCVRLYPCLVLEGAPLADIWRAGGFTPWNFEDTLAFMAEACLRFWEADIPLIRMGVAAQPGLEERILAGPRHPALGAMVRAAALAAFIAARLRASPLSPASGPFPPLRLRGPRRYQGEFWGQRGNLIPTYSVLGISPKRTFWGEEAYFTLLPEAGAK